MTSQDLHGLAGRLQRGFEADAISEAQLWLLEAAESELQYRHRRIPRATERCWCGMCRPLDEWCEDGSYLGP